MKIYYFHLYDGNPNSGVTKKIIGQVSKLIELGSNVQIIFIGGLRYEYPNYEFIKCIKIKELDDDYGKGILFKIKRQHKLAKIAKGIVSSLDKGDIIYTRDFLPVLFYIYDSLNFEKKYLMITEHNSNGIKESKLEGDIIFYIIDLIIGSFMLKRTDGIVGVTDEITDYELKRIGNETKPHITIGNGIDVNSVRVRIPPEIKNNEVNLLFLAYVSRWHGITRLLEGLSIYKGKYKVNLNIIGDGKDMMHLKEFVAERKVKNVKFWGFLVGKPLDEFFDKCHLAIGSLAVHKVGLTTISALKFREYAARGIPFIHSAYDSDFPQDFPYHLKVLDADSPIDIEELIDFALKINENPSHPKEMRLYAENNLDWSIKMSKLKHFFDSFEDRSLSHEGKCDEASPQSTAEL